MRVKLKIGQVIIDAFEVKSIWGKARGLMFSKRKNLLFIFNKKDIVPLHMMFVFYPILVVFFDKDKVVEKRILKPFSVYTPKHKADKVLEIASKDLEKINNEINLKSCLEYL